MRARLASIPAIVFTTLSAVGIASSANAQVNPDQILTTDVANLSVIHAFGASSANGNNVDGCSSISGLQLGSDGNFYGETIACGPFGAGTIFSVAANGTFKVLHSFSALNGNGFSNADGSVARGDLIEDASGIFYGTTQGGGAGGCGTVFSIDTQGSFHVIHSFETVQRPLPTDIGDTTNTNIEGCNLFKGLALGPDGALYGTARFGGSKGLGTIFRVTKDGQNFTVLHTFAGPVRTSGGLTPGTPTDGALPDGALVFYNNRLYGNTLKGGRSALGMVFMIPLATDQLVDLHDFSAQDLGGSSPIGGVVPGSDGMLYGTSLFGGANGTGTIYRLSPDGSLFQLVHTFSELSDQVVSPGSTVGVNNDGAYPDARLFLSSSGDLYGSTPSGGANGTGCLFSITTSGQYRLLRSFDASDANELNAYGAASSGILAMSASRQTGTTTNIFGITGNGSSGPTGNGVIFQLSISNTAPIIYRTETINGAQPSLVETSDPVTVTGLKKPSKISITAGSGAYSVNGGPFTTAPGIVNNGDLVRIQATSLSTSGNSFSVKVNWGVGTTSVIRRFYIKTR